MKARKEYIEHPGTLYLLDVKAVQRLHDVAVGLWGQLEADQLRQKGVRSNGIPTLERYVQADLEMKRKALDSANGPQPTQAPQPLLSSNLIEWLEAL